MITPAAALAALRAQADPARAAEAAAYHKAPRVYLGLPVPAIEALVADWRAGADVAERVALARGLWDSDVHEARIAAAKLLTQARIREDEPLVWAEFLRWVPTFDAWAIADHACKAGERRLVADPSRLDARRALDRATRTCGSAAPRWSPRCPGPSSPTRRRPSSPPASASSAGPPATSPTATGSSRRPSAGGCAASRSHDPDRVRAFLDGPGRGLKPFARREALRRL